MGTMPTSREHHTARSDLSTLIASWLRHLTAQRVVPGTLAMLLVPLATAILISHEYRRWIGWLCAVAGALVLVGVPTQLAVPDAAVIGGIGIELFLVALLALGVSMWRRAGRISHATAKVASSGLDPAMAAR